MMFGKDSDKRFEIAYKEGSLTGHKIIVDRVTGVNYLFSWDGQAAGLTVLLDSEGKPLVSMTRPYDAPTY
jgi:hypothetical protein